MFFVNKDCSNSLNYKEEGPRCWYFHSFQINVGVLDTFSRHSISEKAELLLRYSDNISFLLSLTAASKALLEDVTTQADSAESRACNAAQVCEMLGCENGEI